MGHRSQALYHLQLGSNCVLPLLLFLKAPSEFSDTDFQELLLVVRDKILPPLLQCRKQFGKDLIELSPTLLPESMNPIICNAGSNLKFAYHFTATRPSHLFIAHNSQPGSSPYSAMQVDKKTLMIQILDANALLTAPEQTIAISHYFTADSNKKETPQEKLRNFAAPPVTTTSKTKTRKKSKGISAQIPRPSARIKKK